MPSKGLKGCNSVNIGLKKLPTKIHSKIKQKISDSERVNSMIL
jgi:hypothetical protein